MKVFKKIALFSFVFCFFFVSFSFAQDATSIVRSSRDRIQATTVSTRARMIITSKDGSTSERLIDQYSSKKNGKTSTIIVFQKPASVAGTRFLMLEKEGGGQDQWIFLPALAKLRRIAASEGSGNFVGTDFTYDDISQATRSVDADTHVLLREEQLGGSPCYVIESKPKDSSYQYSKMVSWITKDTLVSLKIDIFDKKGILIKKVESGDTQDVQGRLTPFSTKMTTVSSGTSTEIKIEILKYDDPIPDAVFTTDFVSTGRLK